MSGTGSKRLRSIDSVGQAGLDSGRSTLVHHHSSIQSHQDVSEKETDLYDDEFEVQRTVKVAYRQYDGNGRQFRTTKHEEDDMNLDKEAYLEDNTSSPNFASKALLDNENAFLAQSETHSAYIGIASNQLSTSYLSLPRLTIKSQYIPRQSLLSAVYHLLNSIVTYNATQQKSSILLTQNLKNAIKLLNSVDNTNRTNSIFDINNDKNNDTTKTGLEAIFECLQISLLILKLQSFDFEIVSELWKSTQKIQQLLPESIVNNVNNNILNKTDSWLIFNENPSDDLSEFGEDNLTMKRKNASFIPRNSTIRIPFDDWIVEARTVSKIRISKAKESLSSALSARNAPVPASGYIRDNGTVNNSYTLGPAFTKEALRSAYNDLGDAYYLSGKPTWAFREYARANEFSTTREHILEFCFTAIRLCFETDTVFRAQVYITHAETCPGMDTDLLSQSRLSSCKALVALNLRDYHTAAKLFTSLLPDQSGEDNATNFSNNASSNKPEENRLILSTLEEKDNHFNLLSDKERSAQIEVDTYLESLKLNNFYAANNGSILRTLLTPADVGLYGILCAIATFSRKLIKEKIISNPDFKCYLDATEPSVSEFLLMFYNCKYGSCWKLLSDIIPTIQLDHYLHPHINSLVGLIEKRIFENYLIPISAVPFSKLVFDFGLSDFADNDGQNELNKPFISNERIKFNFQLSEDFTQLTSVQRREKIEDNVIEVIEHLIKENDLANFRIDLCNRILKRLSNHIKDKRCQPPGNGIENKIKELALKSVTDAKSLLMNLKIINAGVVIGADKEEFLGKNSKKHKRNEGKDSSDQDDNDEASEYNEGSTQSPVKQSVNRSHKSSNTQLRKQAAYKQRSASKDVMFKGVTGGVRRSDSNDSLAAAWGIQLPVSPTQTTGYNTPQQTDEPNSPIEHPSGSGIGKHVG